MSANNAKASAAARTANPARRVALCVSIAAASFLEASHGAMAQSAPAPKPSWEFLVASGTLIPTGAQRQDLQRANITAAQVAYVVRPDLAITGTFGWARSRDLASIARPSIDVFTYDVGAEARSNRWSAGRATTFSPFAGVGVGGRSYNYHSPDVDATHNAAGYVSAGGEFGRGRVRLRLEVRDYVTSFKPFDGAGTGSVRNDVTAMIGLRITGRQK